ncbi:MAG: hypothetical protein NUV67_05280 [archaeon]|nr:hypothetical protein [archaeon]
MARDSLGWRASRAIKDKAKEKILLAKEDVPLLALLVAEFVLTLVIVLAIILYLDGRFNEMEFPFNLIIFAAIVYAVLHFYQYTEAFRRLRGMKRESSFRIFLLEFAIFLVVAISGYIYQDPSINTLPYPFNILLFLAVLSVPLWLYVKEKFIEK